MHIVCGMRRKQHNLLLILGERISVTNLLVWYESKSGLANKIVFVMWEKGRWGQLGIRVTCTFVW